jgi:hypothetical protein
VRDSLDS